MGIYISKGDPPTWQKCLNYDMEADELPPNSPEINANHRASSCHAASLTIKRNRLFGSSYSQQSPGATGTDKKECVLV